MMIIKLHIKEITQLQKDVTFMCFHQVKDFQYLWSFVKLALVASAEPCAPTMERTHWAVTPSHTLTAPSLDAVTYMPPVEEYLTCMIKYIFVNGTNFLN